MLCSREDKEFQRKSHRVNPSLRKRCASQPPSKGITLLDARLTLQKNSLIEPITPIVKNPSIDSEFLRELPDVVARLHSFDSMASKLVAIPLPFFVFHFAAPFPQSVYDETVSWLDVHSSPSP